MIEIREWMSKPVICVKEKDSVMSAINKMAKHNIGCVVIEDKAKKTHGILTERDIVRKVVKPGKDTKKTKVKDVMTKNVKTVPVHTPVLEVLQTMKKGNFRDMPITENGKVVGIITSIDLIKMFSK